MFSYIIQGPATGSRETTSRPCGRRQELQHQTQHTAKALARHEVVSATPRCWLEFWEWI